MQAIQLAEAGTVIRTQGVDGTMLMQSVHIIKELSHGEALFLWQKGEKVPYFVVAARQTTNQEWLIKLEGIDSRELAKEFINHAFWLKADLLEQVEKDTGWEGWLLRDSEGMAVGEVIRHIDMGEYILLTVQYGETEVLVPVHDSLLVAVNEKEKSLSVRISDGLLNLED